MVPEEITRVIRNETEHYQKGAIMDFITRLMEAAEHLIRAARLTEEPWFRLYLEAKVEELRTGSEEARRIAAALWIRHDNPVDIIISSAVEQYDDQWKGIKGSASGAVMVTNESMTALNNSILEKVPRLEREAPWELKQEKIAKLVTINASRESELEDQEEKIEDLEETIEEAEYQLEEDIQLQVLEMEV